MDRGKQTQHLAFWKGMHHTSILEEVRGKGKFFAEVEQTKNAFFKRSENTDLSTKYLQFIYQASIQNTKARQASPPMHYEIDINSDLENQLRPQEVDLSP